MIRSSLALLATILVLAACGSEPTAVHTRPEAGTEARRSTSGQLTVAVYGPSQVADGECASWSSSVSGGTEPYQYSWSGVTTTDNTSGMVWGSIGGGTPSYNFVWVDVTDANGLRGSGGQWVYVPYNGGHPGMGCI